MPSSSLCCILPTVHFPTPYSAAYFYEEDKRAQPRKFHRSKVLDCPPLPGFFLSLSRSSKRPALHQRTVTAQRAARRHLMLLIVTPSTITHTARAVFIQLKPRPCATITPATQQKNAGRLQTAVSVSVRIPTIHTPADAAQLTAPLLAVTSCLRTIPMLRHQIKRLEIINDSI
jgi:hypothetical protein